MPLRSAKEDVVHNLGCPVVSRMTLFEIFLLTVCSFCAILNNVMSCVICAKTIVHSWFSHQSEHRKVDIDRPRLGFHNNLWIVVCKADF